MRTVLIVAALLSAAAAAQDMGDHAAPLRLVVLSRAIGANPGKLMSQRQARWPQDELLGDALGRWLGVDHGRWDVFPQTLAMGDGGPVIAGTFRKNAAEIQLRWRPGD
ncbi:MAG: hypothetical protein KGM97_10400 [Alphaproteobacteria bacterium]|nr:hypothetical protein [Alphaproteobacteria bacterium]MDE2631385.1 hypothetical protein [Alphaproteobacteria bacterium]